MGPTDEELMSAYVAGDARAFEKLFARLAPRVHAFFRRSFRDEGVADDLLQVTFMKVHRARVQYRLELRRRPPPPEERITENTEGAFWNPGVLPGAS